MKQMVQKSPLRRMSTWTIYFLFITLSTGILFRFCNIDEKIYWYDEVFTSMRASGFAEKDAVLSLSQGGITSAKEIQRFQHIRINSDSSDTINSLAREDPQHTPLFYLLTRYWIKWFGESPAATRGLSAVISLLVFPCLFWLCYELFGSYSPAWYASALVAVSPYHIQYAQEAREYSLWTVAILFSSAALLRAYRVNTSSSWAGYLLALFIAFYAHLLSGLLALAHGCYVIYSESFKLSKRTAGFILSSGIALLLLLPWLLVIVLNHAQVQTTMGWAYEDNPFRKLIATWILNFDRIFIDFFHNQLLTLLLLALVAYSLIYLYKNSAPGAWLFIYILLAATALPLILPDIVIGGRLTRVGRYLLPSILGIQLSLAYLFDCKITRQSTTKLNGKLWGSLVLAIILAGIVSYLQSYRSEVVWTKMANHSNPKIAKVINNRENPLLISDAEVGDLISLSYLLHPSTSMWVKPGCYGCRLNIDSERVNTMIENIPGDYSDVYLYKPRATSGWIENTQSRYKKNFRLTEIVTDLWRIEVH